MGPEAQSCACALTGRQRGSAKLSVLLRCSTSGGKLKNRVKLVTKNVFYSLFQTAPQPYPAPVFIRISSHPHFLGYGT